MEDPYEPMVPYLIFLWPGEAKLLQGHVKRTSRDVMSEPLTHLAFSGPWSPVLSLQIATHSKGGAWIFLPPSLQHSAWALHTAKCPISTSSCSL